MTRSSFCLIFLFLSSILYAQDWDSWRSNHAESESIVYYGILNNCVPVKIAIHEYPDSLVGIWQLNNEEIAFLVGEKKEDFFQFIDLNSDDEPQGFLLLSTETNKVKYAYWVNKDRTQIRTFPISTEENKVFIDKINYCKKAEADIWVKQIDQHSYKGVIYDELKQEISSFTLNDSLYLKTYSTAIPTMKTKSNRHWQAIAITNCLQNDQGPSLKVDRYCDCADTKFISAAIPTAITTESEFILQIMDSIAQVKTKHTEKKTYRPAFLATAYPVPYYIDKTLLSTLFILDIDNVKTPLVINKNLKKNRPIELEDIFRRKSDYQELIDNKAAEVKRNLIKQKPEHKDFIKNLEFTQTLFTKTGFIFITDIDPDHGIHSFHLPYKDLKGNYQWFHPLKKLVQNGD